jgi:Holliday junction DNA helicase RuvB
MDKMELVSPEEVEADTRPPILPSPASLGDFVGQARAVGLLSRILGLEEFPPTLISGPPGLGKSTLAECLARARGRTAKRLMGYELFSHNLHQAAEELSEGDVLIIDEAQTLSPEAEVALQVCVETGMVPTFSGRWKAVGIVLVTMDQSRLSRPLRDRCIFQAFLSYYTVEELTEIAWRARNHFGLECEDRDAYQQIARRARGIPRLALRYTKLVSLYGPRSRAGVKSALKEIGVDEHGLTPVDREYLSILRGSRRPMSLRSIAAAMGVAERLVKDEIEPYLLRAGLIEVTGQGRVPLARRSG